MRVRSRLTHNHVATLISLGAIIFATGLPARADDNPMPKLFAMADKLCLHRYQTTESDAYTKCRGDQSVAIARLVQGLYALSDKPAFEALYKQCLIQGPDMAAGFPDFDDALNCIVAQVPEARKIFFSDEQQ